MIYKAADYLGKKAEVRANDLSRDTTLRSKDRGLADAYANIKQMILHDTSIGLVDYWVSNKVIRELPNNLK